MAINKSDCCPGDDASLSDASALPENMCAACIMPVVDGSGAVTDFSIDGVSLSGVLGGVGVGGTSFTCADLNGCSFSDLGNVAALGADGTVATVSSGGIIFSTLPAGSTDTYTTSATYVEGTGVVTLVDNDAANTDPTFTLELTEPVSGPLNGGGNLTYSAAFNLVNDCLEDIKALIGVAAGDTDFGVLPGDEVTDNANLLTILNDIAQCLEDEKNEAPIAINTIDFAPTANPNEYSVSLGWTNSAGTAQTTTDATPVVISGGAAGATVTNNAVAQTTTINDGTNSVTLCTQPEHRVRESATACVYEVLEGCGAAATVVETIDARKAITFELGQQSNHFVDDPIADQHCFVAPPASVGTNIVITGATYCVGGDIDFDIDFAGTTVSFGAVSGSGDLAALTPTSGALTFPLALANLAEIREAVKAVNTAGEEFVLTFYGCYCPV